MEIVTVLLCISVHFQEQECIGCTMCTSIKFLHRCVTWEAHCFRGRRIASVKIKTSQVMLGKCMIFHYWTGVPWRCQSLRYDPSYFVAMIFAWYCGTCFCRRVITQLAGKVARWLDGKMTRWLGGNVLLLSLSLPHNMIELAVPTRTSFVASSVCE